MHLVFLSDTLAGVKLARRYDGTWMYMHRRVWQAIPVKEISMSLGRLRDTVPHIEVMWRGNWFKPTKQVCSLRQSTVKVPASDYQFRALVNIHRNDRAGRPAAIIGPELHAGNWKCTYKMFCKLLDAGWLRITSAHTFELTDIALLTLATTRWGAVDLDRYIKEAAHELPPAA